MKSWLKPLLIAMAAILLVVIAARLAWPILPVSLRVRIIRSEYVLTNDWFPTYNRLGDMLRLGMSPDEVGAVLGPPDIQQTFANGKRWSYDETGPTSGGTCMVDFASDGGVLRLCYFVNVQHVLFRDSPHREFGSPVDGGRFEGDLLQLRWAEWHRGERSNNALQPTATAPSVLTNR